MSQSRNDTLTQPVSEDRDHIQGSMNAPVTLVEYGDYECPYCGQAYPIVKQVQEELSDDLRLVFRNFPLENMHPHAERAAEAAEAAGAQGAEAFWAMQDYLYKHQDDLTDDNLMNYAAELGLDTDRFKQDFETSTFEDRVQDDFQSGIRSGVNGTPTFFVNGERFDGDWTDVETFAAALREYR